MAAADHTSAGECLGTSCALTLVFSCYFGHLQEIMAAGGRRRLRQDADLEAATEAGILEDLNHAHATGTGAGPVSAQIIRRCRETPVTFLMIETNFYRTTNLHFEAGLDAEITVVTVFSLPVVLRTRPCQRHHSAPVANPAVLTLSRRKPLFAGAPAKGAAAERRVWAAGGAGRCVKLRRVRGGATGGPAGRAAVAPAIGAQSAGEESQMIYIFWISQF